MPELCPWEEDTFEADVSIQWGPVPESLESPHHSGVCFQSSPDLFLFFVKGIVRYLVTRGRKIVIQALPGAEQRDVRLFLLNSAFNALFHQRGLFPLHASGIRVKDQCILFSGDSGHGKSTLANAFVRRGYDLHTDDIAVAEIGEDGGAVIHPAYPQMKLWEETLQKIQDKTPYAPLRRRIKKFAVPLTGAFSRRCLPVGKIYVLCPRNRPGFDITPVTGMDKFNILKGQTHRFQFTKGLGTQTEHFRFASVLGRQVPVSRVHRPQKPFMVEELADVIQGDLERSGLWL